MSSPVVQQRSSLAQAGLQPQSPMVQPGMPQNSPMAQAGMPQRSPLAQLVIQQHLPMAQPDLQPLLRNMRPPEPSRGDEWGRRGCCCEFLQKIWSVVQSFFYYLFCCCLFVRRDREIFHRADPDALEPIGVYYLKRALPIPVIERAPRPPGYDDRLQQAVITAQTGVSYNLSESPRKAIEEDPTTKLKKTFALGLRGAGNRPTMHKKLAISLPPFAIKFFPRVMQKQFCDLPSENLHLHVVIHTLDNRFPFAGEEGKLQIGIFAQPIVQGHEARFFLAFSNVENAESQDRQKTSLKVDRFAEQEVGSAIRREGDEERIVFFPNNGQILLTNPDFSAFFTAIDIDGEHRTGVAVFHIVVPETAPLLSTLAESRTLAEFAGKLDQPEAPLGLQTLRNLLLLP